MTSHQLLKSSSVLNREPDLHEDEKGLSAWEKELAAASSVVAVQPPVNLLSIMEAVWTRMY